MENITKKNTKDTIYDAYTEVSEAYDEALQRIKILESTKVDPQKQIVAKVKQETIKTAQEVVGLGVLNPEIVEKYESLNKAIDIKTEELKNVYKIEVETNTLTALVNANIDKRLELEKQDKESQEAYKKKLADRESEYREAERKLEESFANKSKELRKNYEELESNSKLQRTRDEESYKYQLVRDKKIENDKWADEKAQREKVLADKEISVSEREAKMDEMETTITELKNKVDGIPKLLEEATVKGAEAKAKELEKIHAIKEASTKKDAEWEKKMFEQKVESLTDEVGKSNKKATDLEVKLNDAYMEITGIATKTVQSSGIRLVESGAKNEK